jgi:hypothetical protein
MKVEWSTFKSFVSTRSLSIQWIQSGDVYIMCAADGFFELSCEMFTDELLTDTLDFVTNFKAQGNKRVNVVKQAALSNAEEFRFRGDATPWTACAAGVSTNLELLMTEERFIDGGVVVVKDANPGDYCVFQVVHPIVGVVEQFVNKWYVTPGTGTLDVKVYPAKVPAGLIIRVVYHNVGATASSCGVNLRLHKAGV